MANVRLNKDTEKKLNNLAATTKRSKSFFIKEALDMYLEDIEEW